MGGEWSWYGGVQFNGEGVSLMKGEWSFYINRKFNGWRMVTLRRWAILRRENGHSMEVASLMEENGHVTEMASLMEGEIMLQRWPL